jgi:hypothetical protein
MTPLDHATFLSQLIVSARTFQLRSEAEAQALVDRELRVFAAERGLSEHDVASLRPRIDPLWFRPGEHLETRLRDLAVEQLARHAGHSSFKEMAKAVGRGTSQALDADGWLNTDQMGPALLELIHAHSDWELYKRYRLHLGAAVPPPSALEDQIQQIRGAPGLEIVCQRMDRTWGVKLPNEGARFDIRATYGLDDPAGELMLRYGTGDPGAATLHFESSRKEGDSWVPVRPSPTARVYPLGLADPPRLRIGAREAERVACRAEMFLHDQDILTKPRRATVLPPRR